MLTINTNLWSLNAQKNLRKTEQPLMTAMQRLSSGLRINSAKDDAAGLAIGDRMNTQVRAMTVAIRNSNDGISISQTAEGTLEEINNSLQRIYELAEQAASYNTPKDRQSLNKEADQLLQEIARVVAQTRYNGELMLQGGFDADIQVGTDVKEIVNVKLADVTPTEIGVDTNFKAINAKTLVSTDYSNLASQIANQYLAASAAKAQVGGIEIGNLETKQLSSEKVSMINAKSGLNNVSAFSIGNGIVGAEFGVRTGTAGSAIAASTAGFTVTRNTVTSISTATITGGAISINGVSIGTVTVSGAAGSGASAFAASTVVAAFTAAINAKQSETGLRAELVRTSGATIATAARVVLVNATGALISVNINSDADTTITRFFSEDKSVAAGANGAIVFNAKKDADNVDFSTTTVGRSLAGNVVTDPKASISVTTVTLDQSTVDTVYNANMSMIVVKEAMDVINSSRAIIGAKMNRFESTIRNLENVRENLNAAKSRIMDTDFAVETANLTSAQIRQQAGITILTQANMLPQSVLALLGK